MYLVTLIKLKKQFRVDSVRPSYRHICLSGYISHKIQNFFFFLIHGYWFKFTGDLKLKGGLVMRSLELIAEIWLPQRRHSSHHYLHQRKAKKWLNSSDGSLPSYISLSSHILKRRGSASSASTPYNSTWWQKLTHFQRYNSAPQVLCCKLEVGRRWGRGCFNTSGSDSYNCSQGSCASFLGCCCCLIQRSKFSALLLTKSKQTFSISLESRSDCLLGDYYYQ